MIKLLHEIKSYKGNKLTPQHKLQPHDAYALQGKSNLQYMIAVVLKQKKLQLLQKKKIRKSMIYWTKPPIQIIISVVK